jgi:penicillin amidase
MGYTLAYLDTETERYAAAARVGFAAAAALFPTTTPIQEPIQPMSGAAPLFETSKLPPPGNPDPAARIFADASDAFLGRHGEERAVHASNNWAVSPRRSATGHALLAGDPHLDLTLPSIWYEAHIVVPGKIDVYGATIPGAPFILIGFNRDVAWSVTNNGVDVLDFFTEQVDDTTRPRRHVVDDDTLSLIPREEVYRDAAGTVVATDTTYFSFRGPLRKVNGQWMSLRWTVLESGTEPQAFLDAQRARTVRELHDAFGKAYRAPSQNLVAADRDGHIALRSTGRFPVRAGDGRGDVIRDGRSRSSDWKGDVPLVAYPQVFDPPQGYVASANQQPLQPGSSAYWWGGDFDPWRALRINEILRSDSSVTVDEMRAFQTDPSSMRARLFASRILEAARNVVRAAPARTNRDSLNQAVTLLSEWDFRYTKDNRRAVLFEEVMSEITNRTWDEFLPDSGTRRVATPSSAVLLQLLSDSTSPWWDDRRTPTRETRDDVVAASLTTALGRVVARRGAPDSDGWRWDQVRFANIGHLLRLPSLSAANVPVQGGTGTLSPSSGSGSHGASWRMVVDLGPEIRAWTIYPGGQSGNPASNRYRDRIDAWSRGELSQARIPRTPSQLATSETGSVLNLRPRR